MTIVQDVSKSTRGTMVFFRWSRRFKAWEAKVVPPDHMGRIAIMRTAPVCGYFEDAILYDAVVVATDIDNVCVVGRWPALPEPEIEKDLEGAEEHALTYDIKAAASKAVRLGVAPRHSRAAPTARFLP